MLCFDAALPKLLGASWFQQGNLGQVIGRSTWLDLQPVPAHEYGQQRSQQAQREQHDAPWPVQVSP